MLTRIEGHSFRDDLVEDIIEPSSSFLIDGSKVLQNRNSYSTLNKQSDNPSSMSINDFRNRLPLTLPRSNTSSFLISNDERRKEIDYIIKYLYDGKVLTTANDECPPSDISETSNSTCRKGSFTIISNKSSADSIDLFSQDDDITLLHRELQEKELDITHLHKETQELRLENKLIKAKSHSTDYFNMTPEGDVLRRERDVLQNELRTTQELLAKLQKQQHQNVLIARSNRVDEVILHQKEALEKRLKLCEKQVRLLTSENEKVKQTSQQTERTVEQLRRENETLQQKVTEANKRNDDLFYQEFHSFRNDLKTLKQRNQDLCQENLRLQQEQQNLSRRLPLHEHQQISSLSSLKALNRDARNLKIARSESPDMSEASDSTSYLTTVTIERYNNHPSGVIDGLAQQTKHDPLSGQEDNLRKKYFTTSSKEKLQNNEDITNYDDAHPISLHLSPPTYPLRRSMAFIESQRLLNNQLQDRPQIRKNTEMTSSRRPYAPSSIDDIDLNDVVKFSRAGGKISKGSVKYIGLLPGQTDLCLGIELENEESKHDGVYEEKRLFQCKPNKGIFVGFNKVIMAWKDK